MSGGYNEFALVQRKHSKIWLIRKIVIKCVYCFLLCSFIIVDFEQLILREEEKLFVVFSVEVESFARLGEIKVNQFLELPLTSAVSGIDGNFSEFVLVLDNILAHCNTNFRVIFGDCHVNDLNLRVLSWNVPCLDRLVGFVVVNSYCLSQRQYVVVQTCQVLSNSTLVVLV